MDINASIPNYKPSESSKLSFLKLFSRKKEIYFMDSAKPVKIFGEILSAPPKERKPDPSKVIIKLKIQNNQTVYAKVNKSVLEKTLQIKAIRLRGKNTKESTAIVQKALAGMMYKSAFSEPNPQAIREKLEEACLMGSKDAALMLAKCYDENAEVGRLDVGDKQRAKVGRDELPREARNALAYKYYARAARLGVIDIATMKRLAELADNNEAKASWYEEAANHGDILSMAIIGKLYWDGKGVQKNKKMAMEWFEKFNSFPNLVQSIKPLEKARACKVMGKDHEMVKYYKLAAKKNPHVYEELGDWYYAKAFAAVKNFLPKNSSHEQAIQKIFKSNNLEVKKFRENALLAYSKAGTDEATLKQIELTMFASSQVKADKIDKLKRKLNSIIESKRSEVSIEKAQQLMNKLDTI